MKVCPQCQLSYDDSAQNCGKCGGPLVTIQNQQPYNESDDHTAEFDVADISENKVLAMVPYLLGWLGVLITLLVADSSPYVGFHVRQAMKILVVTTLSRFLLIIPILGWVVAPIWYIISIVLRLICFFRVCKGKAMEPPLVDDFKFLK